MPLPNNPTTNRFQRGPAEESDFFSLTVKGKTVTVFRPAKPGGGRLSNFYVKGRLNGKQFYRGTGFARKGDAKEKAIALVTAELEGWKDFLTDTKLRKEKTGATVGELVAAYEKRVRTFALKKIEASSVKHNVNSLRLIVRRVHFVEDEAGEERKLTRKERDARNAKVDALPASILTKELAAKFREAHVASAGADRLERKRRVNGLISTMAAARSLFSEQGMLCYEGLKLPDLSGFLTAPLPEKPERVMRHFDQAQMVEMAAAAQLLKGTDPEVYLTHLCYRHLGMRNIEIRKARVGWLVERADTSRVMMAGKDGRMELVQREIAGFMEILPRADFDPKRSAGIVPIDAAVMAEMLELWQAANDQWLKTHGRLPDAFLIAPGASETEREKIVNRRHGDFVRPWFEDFDKVSYELRRWAGTKILELTGSMEMSGRFLRHKPAKDARVFIASYATKLPPPPPITFADCGLPSPAVAG